MRKFAIGTTGLLVAGVLSGCCCGGGPGACARTEPPYSDGNPYEIGGGYPFLGLGYYTDKYGFLCRHYPCSSSTSSSVGSYDSGQNLTPAPQPAAPVPAVPTPYDSSPAEPSVPPPAT